MDRAILLLAIFAIVVALFYIRNEVIFRIRVEWNHKVFAALTNLLHRRSPDHEKYTYNELLGAIRDRNVSFWLIGSWTLESLVQDEEKFRFVMENLPHGE